ncbi:hypothetical protein V1281_001534 [Nitrobacteraceae bacterium AZCC 2161]
MKTYRFQRPRPKADKPQESRAWKILNSSIVIWLLTAALGSVVTFTFTNLQSCLKDADEKATRGNKVFGEILDRRVTIAHAINDSKSIADLSNRLKNIGYLRYEFKDVPIVSLTAELKEFQTITRKLPFAEAWGYLNIAVSGLSEDDLPYLEVFGGGDVSDKTAPFLTKLKEILPKYNIYLNRELAFAKHFAVVPYCTVPDAFASMWRSRDRILEFKEFETPREAPFVPLLPGKN